MLSLFPELLSFSLVAIFVLRVFVGLLFMVFGYGSVFKTTLGDGMPTTYTHRVIGFISLVGGLLLVVGLYTQAVALILALVAGISAYMHQRRTGDRKDMLFSILLFLITLSFLFLGPGIFAFDLPL